jgi:glutaredoxin
MKGQRAIVAALAAALLLGYGSQTLAGKLYKWVDDSGNVSYQDQPPPNQDTNLEVREMSDRGIGATGEDYVAPSVRTSQPVAFYAVPECEVCDVVRLFLSKRGVPFEERNLTEASVQKKLSDLGGRLEVPTVTVGSLVLTGYDRSALAAALDAAGYGETPDDNAEQAAAQEAAKQAAVADGNEEDDGLKLLPQDEPFKESN